MPVIPVMFNSIEQNIHRWNERHLWPKDGDEWDGQARACHVSYTKWKNSLAQHLITPYATGKTVLEIAPGHGRWTEYIVAVSSKIILADLSPNCIDHCKKRFARFDNMEYYITDGKSLPSNLNGSVDFVFSFDSFVHMDSTTIYLYLKEISRVMKHGGKAIIHHANRKHVRLSFLRRYGRGGKMVYRLISEGLRIDGDGWRR